MAVFEKIVTVDPVCLTSEGFESLHTIARQVVVYDSFAQDEQTVRTRIADADAILVPWQTTISEATIQSCDNLKYIGLCGTSSKKIDRMSCEKKGIVVTNVVDYGDEAVVEFIILQLLSLVRGKGVLQWDTCMREISGKTLGIIGMGVIGTLLVDAAQGLKMRVLYTSRTQKNNVDAKGAQFVSKQELLKQSDFVTLQTPRDVLALTQDDFKVMQASVLINTTLGTAFDSRGFSSWIAQPGKFAIMDAASDKTLRDACKDKDRVIIEDYICGYSLETRQRLSKKVLENMRDFLKGAKK